MAFFHDNLGKAGTRKAELFWILLKQDDVVAQHQLDHADYLHLAPDR